MRSFSSSASSYPEYLDNKFLARSARFASPLFEQVNYSGSETTQELDPTSLVINANLGQTFYQARQYDQAIEQLQKTLEMDANFVPAYLHLGVANLQKRMFDEAISSFQKGNQLSPYTTDMSALLGHAYAVSGKRAAALKILSELNELSKQQYVPLLAWPLSTSVWGIKTRHSRPWKRHTKIASG